MGNPLVEKFATVSLHQLEATLEFFIDPAGDVSHSFGSETTALSEASIYRHRILILKEFDNQVEQNLFLPNVPKKQRR